MNEPEEGLSRRQVLGAAVGLSSLALTGTACSAFPRQDSKTEHPNATRVRRLYEAVAARDVERLGHLLAPDVTLHIPGTSLVAGVHSGKESVVRLFQAVVQQTEGTFRMDLLEVMANGQYAATKHRWTAERNARRIEMDNINVFRFDESGLLIERWEFIEDQQAHDEFWS
jgi:uncharacterized protein